MRRPCALVVAALALTVLPLAARADSPPDPLRLIPMQADLVLKVESPRGLVDAVTAIGPLRQLVQFGAVQELLSSTNVRRARQLIAYYEKELGAAWPELLDRLTGGGIALATKFEGGKDAPVLLVIQGRDAAFTARAFKIVLGVVEQELARQDAKERPTKDSYRDTELIHFGPKLHVALAGAAVLVANKPAAIHLALDLYLDHGDASLATAPGPAEAKKLLPADPLVWMWVNLVPAQQSPMGKEIFALPKGDPAQLVLFGSLLDVIGHSPFLALGVHRAGAEWRATVRMPRGRDATPDGLSLQLAPDGQAGCLPLLEPANVLYSSSFYLDLGKLWNEREKLLKEQPRKQLDKAEQNVGRFLAGRKLSELLNQSGTYYRFVAVAQPKSGYAKFPDQAIPAFAVTSTMRDPAFGQAMEAILRVTALLTGSKAKLKLTEETMDGVKLVGYRFPEDGTLDGDTTDVRFNFSPCFATVGDSFFAASTIELGRDMIAALKRPASAAGEPTVANRSRLYAAGGAGLLTMFEHQLLTQTILNRAVSVEEAKREVKALTDWLRGLGDLRIQADYRPHEFRFDIDWKPKD
jgi:hypothetical protein